MSVTVKLSDGGSNTLTFYIDSFGGPTYIDYDKYGRSTDTTFKHYTIGKKRRWELGINALPSSDRTTLLTIYSLRTTLEFYEDSAAAKTANVFWQGNFNFIPTQKHRHFKDKIYEGSIILEEI